MDDPPTLDREGGKFQYSRAMKDMIEACLQKDPDKRRVPRSLGPSLARAGLTL